MDGKKKISPSSFPEGLTCRLTFRISSSLEEFCHAKGNIREFETDFGGEKNQAHHLRIADERYARHLGEMSIPAPAGIGMLKGMQSMPTMVFR